MAKLFKCIEDRQGASLGVGCIGDVEYWRERAIDWHDSDEREEEIEIVENLPADEIIDYIEDFWEITIVPATHEDTIDYIKNNLFPERLHHSPCAFLDINEFDIRDKEYVVTLSHMIKEEYEQKMTRTLDLDFVSKINNNQWVKEKGLWLDLNDVIDIIQTKNEKTIKEISEDYLGINREDYNKLKDVIGDTLVEDLGNTLTREEDEDVYFNHSSIKKGPFEYSFLSTGTCEDVKGSIGSELSINMKGE